MGKVSWRSGPADGVSRTTWTSRIMAVIRRSLLRAVDIRPVLDMIHGRTAEELQRKLEPTREDGSLKARSMQ